MPPPRTNKSTRKFMAPPSSGGGGSFFLTSAQSEPYLQQPMEMMGDSRGASRDASMMMM